MPFKARFREFLVISAWLAFTVSTVPAQWKKLDSGTLAWLYALEFVDAKRGWAGGTNGTLIVTDDGGASWRRAAFPNRDAIRDIVFVNARTGWLLCERSNLKNEESLNRSYLMKTEDGGITWTKLEFGSTADRMVRLVISSAGEGIAIGEGGSIAGLPVGTRVPAKIGLPIRFLMLGGVWLDSSRLILVGGGGTTIMSDDLGTSWQTTRFSEDLAETRLSSVYFSDASKGWIVGNKGTILSSINGGRNWVSAKKVTNELLLDVGFLDKRLGFAVGDNGAILSTEDAGATWTRPVSPTRHRLERVAFAGRRVVAVGFGGTIVAADIEVL